MSEDVPAKLIISLTVIGNSASMAQVDDSQNERLAGLRPPQLPYRQPFCAYGAAACDSTYNPAVVNRASLALPTSRRHPPSNFDRLYLL